MREGAYTNRVEIQSRNSERQAHSNNMLSKYLSGVPGYFRENESDKFPWLSRDGSTWYALLTIEAGQIKRYGFTSANNQRVKLLAALAEAPAGSQLLGVWTGSHKTHLFVLDIEIAKVELPKTLKP